MKVRSTTICDQVRTEQGGKNIIIGVYKYDIVVPSFPCGLPLTLWLQLDANKNGAYDVEFRATKDRHLIAQVTGTIEIKDHTRTLETPLPPMVLQLAAPGTVVFQFREKGKRWSTMRKVEIDQKKSTFPTASPQPSGQSPSGVQPSSSRP